VDQSSGGQASNANPSATKPAEAGGATTSTVGGKNSKTSANTGPGRAALLSIRDLEKVFRAAAEAVEREMRDPEHWPSPKSEPKDRPSAAQRAKIEADDDEFAKQRIAASLEYRAHLRTGEWFREYLHLRRDLDLSLYSTTPTTKHLRLVPPEMFTALKTSGESSTTPSCEQPQEISCRDVPSSCKNTTPGPRGDNAPELSQNPSPETTEVSEPSAGADTPADDDFGASSSKVAVDAVRDDDDDVVHVDDQANFAATASSPAVERGFLQGNND
ncbi:unnamed protein product, partial [Amoebophrya sp. A120]